MFSRRAKKNLLLALMGLFIFSTFACGLKTGEEKFVKKPAQIKSDFSCLDNVGEKFEKYFDQKLSAAEVTVFFDCAKTAMKTFKNRTDGRISGHYTPEELRSYFYKFFIKNNVITDELLREGMRIKQTMVGGSLTRLTKSEIERGIDLLELIKQKALVMRPYVMFFDVGTVHKQPPEVVEKALLALQDVADGFGVELAKNKSDYRFDSFSEFLKEFRKFLKWDEDEHQLSESYFKINDWIELVRSFKNLIFDSNDESISANEWRPFLKQSIAWYGVYVRFKYTVQGWDLLYGRGLANLNQLVENVFTNVRNIFSYQKASHVDFERVNKTAYALEKLKLMPFGIKAATVEEVLPEYIRRGFIQVTQPLKDRVVTGVSLEAVGNAYFEYKLWFDIQSTLDGGRDKNGNVEFTTRILNVDVNECSQRMKPTRYVSSDCELARIRNERPMFKEGYDTAYIVGTAEMNNKYDFINLSRLNAVRLAVRALILTFGSYDTEEQLIKTLNQQGITRNELETFYVVSKKLGIDVKLMDPTGSKVGERAYMEGKLFTYASQGFDPADATELISYSELTQLLSVLYSGGNIGQMVFSNMITEVCPPTGETDVFGAPKMTFICFDKYFGNFMYKDLNTLPGMKKYLSELDEVDYQRLRTAFYTGALNDIESKTQVESGDFTFMFAILHYIEISMTKFDTNPKDNRIQFNEALEAYEIFKPLFDSFVNGGESVAENIDENTEDEIDLTAFSVHVDKVDGEYSNEEEGYIGQLYGKLKAKVQEVTGVELEESLESENDAEEVPVEAMDFKSEVAKSYFLLALAKGDGLPSYTSAIWQATRRKVGLDYSSEIKNLAVDRGRLMVVFVEIVKMLREQNINDGESTAPKPVDPDLPVEEDIRNPIRRYGR